MNFLDKESKFNKKNIHSFVSLELVIFFYKESKSIKKYFFLFFFFFFFFGGGWLGA